MKSSKPVSRKSDKATINQKFTTVAEYLTSLPTKQRSIAKKLRTMILEVAPAATELISYQMPAFRWKGKILIYYAAWKEHVSMYPRSASMEKSIKELSNYEGGKGTIQFPIDQPIPSDLVKKIVQFRMKEIEKP